MYQDDVFILKKLFLILTYQNNQKNTKKILILTKKNIFLEIRVKPRAQTCSKLSGFDKYV